jgi:hypothetical protein
MTIQADGQPDSADQIDKETSGADLEDVVVDADTQALNDAIAASEAEDKAIADAAAAATDEGAPPAQEQQTPEQIEAAANAQALPPAQPQRQAPTTVPVPRFNEALRDLNTEREKRIAAEAKLEQLSEMVKAGTITPEMADAVREGREAMPATPADPFAELEARELELAERYDKNEINTVEMTRERHKLERERDAIRADLAKASQAATVESEIGVVTQKIAADFPVLNTITQAQLQLLGPVARVLAERTLTRVAGAPVAFNPDNPKHMVQFRFELANEADRVYGEGKGPLSKQKPAGQQPQVPAKPAAAKPTPQQVQDKVALANKQPPLTPTVRQAVSAEDLDIERRIETMTTEQIEVLFKQNPGLEDRLTRS